MVEMVGTILRLGEKDACNRIFSKDCEISFPEKIPLLSSFSFENPDAVIGNVIPKINRDKGEVVCNAFIREDVIDNFSEEEINIGGYYTNIKSHRDNNVTIIDQCSLQCVSIVFYPEIDGQILKRKGE